MSLLCSTMGLLYAMTLDHLQLAMPVGGEEEARRFFGGLLEMSEDEKPTVLAGRGGCWFRRDSVLLHLGVEEDFHPQKKAHPAFLIEDLDALARKLEALGHSILWDEALPDRRRFYASDPFGNRLEFMAQGDGFSDRSSAQGERLSR